MECPTCRYRVPAEWSLCRRCGAPLHPEPEDTRIPVPASLHRQPSGAAGTPSPSPAPPPAPTSSALAALAAAARNGPPRAAPSTASTRVTPPAPVVARRGVPFGARLGMLVRRHWRRILVLVIVAVALAMSIAAVWPVVFHSDSPSASPAQKSAAQEAVATDLLRTVVGGSRVLFAAGHSFAHVTAANVSASSYHVPVVAATKVATAGTVSMRVNSATDITFASPADANRCVFARDEPARSRTRFVTVRTSDCRAGAAPAQGWITR